uniref:Uncharacterized protein n=1 Tax=Arion vulgaris TaxID=1028688 RepID=A0A0B7BHD9_9EUPU
MFQGIWVSMTWRETRLAGWLCHHLRRCGWECHPMDRTDNLNTFIECGSEEDFRLNKSMSTARSQDFGLKIVVTRKE